MNDTLFQQSPRTIACVRLINWPIDRFRRGNRSPTPPAERTGVIRTDSPSPDRVTTTAHSAPAARPLVLVRTTADRQTVVAACEHARRLRIRPGLSLAQARALHADLDAHEHDALRDHTALLALARYLLRFTPVVSIDPGSAESTSPSAADRIARLARRQSFPQGERMQFEGVAAHPRKQLRVTREKTSPISSEPALLLDLTGVDHLFGGIEPLLRQIQAVFRRLRIAGRLAVGPNVAAAYASTFHPLLQRSPDSLIFHNDRLHPILPVHSLRLPPDLLATLEHLGLNRLEQLFAVPRDQLAARFDPLLTLRLNQLEGLTPEPIVPVRSSSAIVAERHWDFAVESTQTLLPVIDTLLDRLLIRLARIGHGVRELELLLPRIDAAATRKIVRLAGPTRSKPNIARLIRIALEPAVEKPRQSRFRRIVPADPFSKWMSNSTGFTGVRLTVLRSEPVTDEQTGFADARAGFADARAGFADAADSEHRRQLTRLLDTLANRLPRGAAIWACPADSYLPERACFELDAAEHSPPVAAAQPEFTPAPMRLLTKPVEIRVTVAPSHDRDGRPVQVVFPDGPRQIVHAIGPHRIAGEWWRGHDKTRDYFDVEYPTGHRHLLFRVNDTHRWFLQGYL